ncbi:MAG TPA: general stress protein [Frankiaceae bacterium]|nr:general stress protein [Frankiaceae bacterium]
MTQSYAPLIPSNRQPATSEPQHLLGSFPTYAGAEQLVERLSERGFPVEHSRIVGNGLRTVEYVTGRMTDGRAALAGSASGAWFGLLFGLLLGLFSNGSAWLIVLVGSTAIGALWGTAFGFMAHRATRGRRDFASVKGLEAEQYDVLVDAARADEAIRLSGLL